jgi:hypothetical protein
VTVTSVLRKYCGVPYSECVVGSGEVGGGGSTLCNNVRYYIRANCVFVVYLIIPLGLPVYMKFF